MCETCYEHQGRLYHLVGARIAWRLTSSDGPMSVIADWNGELFYGKCHQSPETNNTRYFWIYPLKIEERLAEKRYHNLVIEEYGPRSECVKEICGHDKTENKPENWFKKFKRIFKRLRHFGDLEKEAAVSREDYLNREPWGFFAIHESKCQKCFKQPGEWCIKTNLRICGNCVE